MVVAHGLKSWIAINESCAATGTLNALSPALQAELDFDSAAACQQVNGAAYEQRGLLLAIIRRQKLMGISGPIVLDENGDRHGTFAVVNQHLNVSIQSAKATPRIGMPCNWSIAWLPVDRSASQASSVRISTWSWTPMCCGGRTAAAASSAFLSTVSVP
jgi:hypothetical protein